MTATVDRRRAILVLALALVISVLYVGGDPAQGADANSNRPSTGIGWAPCYQDISQEVGVPFECGQFRVPLDYDNPRETISLALVRIRATAEPYLGSLFLNPGGPGGSGVEFLLGFGPFAQFIWGSVANQYDIVGFDPRGILNSSPLLCFASLDQALQVFPPIPFPSTLEEVAMFRRGDTRLDQACDKNGTEVLNHMSTANVARDLDQLREAVGDDYLNFVGLSYGSYLGQTYANLFPDRVGAFVIDGVLDPIAWANLDAEVPFSTALRSDVGALDTLQEFIRQCDEAGPTYCAIAPDSEARVNAVLERLRQGPILITDPETGESFPYLYSFAIADILGALYNPFSYAESATFIAFLESQASPASLGAQLQLMREVAGFDRDRGRRSYPNFVEGFPAVACQDTTNPSTHLAWFEAGQEAAAQFGIFGEIWTWASSPCAVWSHFDSDVYKGPFDTGTSKSVLVIGNLYDPATRYQGAVTADGLLAGSALLTVDEPGHTSLGISVCAGAVTGQYLATPGDPVWADADLFCPAGENWFVQAALATDSATGVRAEFRNELMDQIGLRP